jgi:Zn-dependent protease
MRGFRIATVRGIPVELHPSWILIAALLVVSLEASLFSQAFPGGGWRGTVWSLVTAVGFFGSLLLHELAHALTSQQLGLPVQRIVLFLFGGVSEARQEMPSPATEFRIAIAGPLTSFVLSLGFLLLGALGVRGGQVGPVSLACGWLALMNFALGVFNLLPGFPLDGGRILRATLWRITGRYDRATRWAARGGQAIAGLIMFVGLLRLFSGEWFGALWFGMLGLLLMGAAGGELATLEVRQLLDEVGVGRIMLPPGRILAPDMTLQEAIDTTFSKSREGGFPVVDGHLAGLLESRQIQDVPPESWPRLRVSQLMTPLGDDEALGPDTRATVAIERFQELGVERLPVVEGGRLVGVVTQSDVIRYLAFHPQNGEEQAGDENEGSQ